MFRTFNYDFLFNQAYGHCEEILKLGLDSTDQGPIFSFNDQMDKLVIKINIEVYYIYIGIFGQQVNNTP